MEFTCKPFVKIFDFQASFHYKIAIRFIFVNRPYSTNSMGALIMRKFLPSCVVWEMVLSQQDACCNFVQPKLWFFCFHRFHPSLVQSHPHPLPVLPNVPSCLFPQAQHCCWLQSRCNTTGLGEGGSTWNVLWMCDLSSLGATGGHGGVAQFTGCSSVFLVLGLWNY